MPVENPGIPKVGMPKVTPIPTPGLYAVKRRFSAQAELIDDLTRASETFRELCDDLAACDATLEAIGAMQGRNAEARRAECLEWIASLTKEVKEQLRLATSTGRSGDRNG